MASKIVYKCASTLNELREILKLQEANLPQNVSASEKESQGFVTVRHTLDLLNRMNRTLPHIIAKYNDQVVAYALSMHPDFGNEIDVLKPMFTKIEEHFPNKTYMVMGQICVHKDFRGQGVFRKLYRTMALTYKNKFSSIITEIDAVNLRSCRAHKTIGFIDLLTYISNNKQWIIVELAL